MRSSIPFLILPVLPLPKRCFFCPTCPSPAGGSLIPDQAFPLTIKGKDVTALQCCLFRSTPSLLAKEGSTAFPKPLSPQGTGDVTALQCCFCPTCPSPAGGSLIPNQAFPLTIKGKDVTALRCSEPLRSKVGGASKPSPYFAGWDRLGNF